jgi:serine/threonine protein kinase
MKGDEDRPTWPLYAPGDLIPGTDCAVIQKLGQGGQAEVYIVRQIFIEKVRVMKLWSAAMKTEGSFRDFRAEAIRQAAMAHDNIASVSGGGMTAETNRRPYFVMDYHEGETLDRVLRRMRKREDALRTEHLAKVARGEPSDYEPHWVNVRDAAQVCIQICAALTHAHMKHGLLHRDVKPANALIVPIDYETSIVKLLDFGISKFIDEAMKNPDDGFYGTLSYAAPEQLRGHACEQSDLYAVAGMFYEMICGKRPFAEIDEVHVLAKAIRDKAPPPISARMRDVTPRLERFFEQNLDKNPSRRCGSAHAMAKELAAISAEYDALYKERATETPKVDNETTDRMPFQVALADAPSPAPEHMTRAKLDSVWDSALGAAVAVEGRAAAVRTPPPPAHSRGEEAFRAEPVSLEKVDTDELVRRARAVEAELKAREVKRELEQPVLLNRRSGTVPFGRPVLKMEPEPAQPSRDARSMAFGPTHPAPHVVPAVPLPPPVSRGAVTGTGEHPRPATGRSGDTTPSRAVPWSRVDEAGPSPSVPVVSQPPPTYRLSPESHQRASHPVTGSHAASPAPAPVGPGKTVPMAPPPAAGIARPQEAAASGRAPGMSQPEPSRRETGRARTDAAVVLPMTTSRGALAVMGGSLAFALTVLVVAIVVRARRPAPSETTELPPLPMVTASSPLSSASLAPLGTDRAVASEPSARLDADAGASAPSAAPKASPAVPAHGASTHKAGPQAHPSAPAPHAAGHSSPKPLTSAPPSGLKPF